MESNQYEFRVAAENSIGIGPQSLPTRTITAEDPINPPTSPILPSVTNYTKNTISIAWSRPR